MNIYNKQVSFFLIDYTFGGGVERVTSDLITNFINNKVTINGLVSLYADLEKPHIDYPKNLQITVLNPSTKKDFYNIFITYFKKYQPDIFIFQGDNMTISLAILKAAKESGVVAIPQYHGSVFAYLTKYSDAEKSNRLKKLFAKIVYPFKYNKLKKYVQSAENGLVCVSKGVADELRILFPNASNIKTIYNPIFLKTLDIVEKENSISFVSRLERKHKNAFLMVKAWNEIAEKYPDWTLNIYGTGSLEEKMKMFCKQKEIENINFKGFVNYISSELVKSKISVSTSNCEGFSMAVAEAISANNAIVSTKSDGGIKDMLIKNKTALLSPKNDNKALAKNIEKMILDKQLRNKLQQNGVVNLEKIVSIDIFEEWKKLINFVSL